MRRAIKIGLLLFGVATSGLVIGLAWLALTHHYVTYEERSLQ